MKCFPEFNNSIALIFGHDGSVEEYNPLTNLVTASTWIQGPEAQGLYEGGGRVYK